MINTESLKDIAQITSAIEGRYLIGMLKNKVADGIENKAVSTVATYAMSLGQFGIGYLAAEYIPSLRLIGLTLSATAISDTIDKFSPLDDEFSDAFFIEKDAEPVQIENQPQAYLPASITTLGDVAPEVKEANNNHNHTRFFVR